MPKPLPISALFGGEDGEKLNALHSAFETAAKGLRFTGEYAVYAMLEKTPQTTMKVHLLDALHAHGYTIKKVDE